MLFSHLRFRFDDFRLDSFRIFKDLDLNVSINERNRSVVFCCVDPTSSVVYLC